MPIVKDLMRDHCSRIDKSGYFCGMQYFKVIATIMTDNIIPGHTKILGISYNFCDTYVNNVYLYGRS